METSFRNKKTLVYNNMLNVEYYFLIKKNISLVIGRALIGVVG